MAMNELLKELRTLNDTMNRLADSLVPSLDIAIFGRFKAFRAYTRNNTLCIKGIPEPDPIRLQELRGLDQTILELKENTEQFLSGLPCNNVLLYGPRGTGKSSAVKAVFNEYRGRGLRMIEMQRDSLVHTLEVADMIRDRKE